MVHSVTFIKGDAEVRPHLDGNGKIAWTINAADSKDAFDDFGLVPANATAISMPELKEQYLEVEGADGKGIDLTDSLAGRPLYSSREGTMTFYRQTYDNWTIGIPDVANYLHGQKMKVVLDDDPLWYYEGRLQITSIESNEYWATIEISYTFEPYKKRVYACYDLAYTGTTDDTSYGIHRYPVLWDLIDFDNDNAVASSYNTSGIITLASTVHYFGGSQAPVIPTITVNGSSSTKVDPDIQIADTTSADFVLYKGVSAIGSPIFASAGQWNKYEAYQLEIPTAGVSFWCSKLTGASTNYAVIHYRKEKL